MTSLSRRRRSAALKHDAPSAPGRGRHIRIDLIIFGILIYILGMLVGVVVGIGISEGGLSAATFQRFISSEDDVEIEETPAAEGDRAVIVDPNSEVSSKSPLVVSGTVVQGGDSTASVIQTGDGDPSQGEEGSNPFSEDEDHAPSPPPSGYAD